MQDNEKKPALRFKGFTDPWEQRKVGDHLIPSKLPGHTGVDARKLTVKLWGKGVVEKTDSYGGSEHTQYYVRHAGQFMYGKLDFLHAAFGIVPAELDNYESTLDSPAFDLSEINGKFLVSRVCKEDFYLKYGTIANGSRKAKRIHEDTFMDMPILVPELEEQERVAALLEALDTLITLHQRKYEKLVNIKKSMLDKMFPKNGASVPEIRFKGFTDPWEQRKISELAEKTYGGGTPTTSNEAFWNGNIPWIQSSDIVDGKLMGVEPRKYITQTGLNSSATQLVPKDSIAIITRVGVGKLAYMPFSYSTSQDFLSLSKLNTEPFFTVYACYKKLQSELNTVQGTSIKGITKDELLAKTISVPVYSEQKQIGSFFTQLDTLITLHQRKLEKLQNIKKSCLEKMFV